MKDDFMICDVCDKRWCAKHKFYRWLRDEWNFDISRVKANCLTQKGKM